MKPPAGPRAGWRVARGSRRRPFPAHGIRLSSASTSTRASTTARDQFAGTVHELIDGTRARIWNYTRGGQSHDGAPSPRPAMWPTRSRCSPAVRLDASLRAEVVHGRAEGAETAVDWVSLLPSARIRWLFAERRRLALVGGYARSANTLNLNWLAYGDPAAPVARVAAAARPGVLVARVGPGTGGNPSFSQIDDDLRRPYTDEFVVGLDAGRSQSLRFTLTGIARREGNLLAVVNTGVPMSGYSTIEIPDEYIFLRNPEDDRTLTVYNRLPSTFGQDTYVLTNPELEAADNYWR